MSGDLRYYEAVGERAIARRSKKTAAEAEGMLRIARATIAAKSTSIPSDLSRLAKHLAVVEIRHVPLAMRGRLVVESGQLVVEVNVGLSEFERRVATAHELAHLVLENRRIAECTSVGRNAAPHSASRRHFEIEELCDRGAEEILLPARWLRDVSRELPVSLNSAREIARQAGCDVEFTLVRLVRLALWDCRLLWWERRDEMLCMTKAFPVVDELFLASVDRQPVADSLLGASLGCRSFVEGNLELTTRDGEFVYRAQCMSLGESVVLAMVVFRT
jgi:Zn-dependent peptidase ImmA (M78 family)